MADDIHSDGQKIFFVYDHSAMQCEEDDLKDAIVYFHPQNLPLERQCILCGQLMGMVNFIKTLTKSLPKCYKLKHMKFAVKHHGVYTLALAGNITEPDSALCQRLSNLLSIFVFYHGSISHVLQAESGNRDTFLSEMAKIWECYLPYVHHYGNEMATIFEPLPRIKSPKGCRSLYLKTHHLLQSCQSHSGVLQGCLIFNNSVLHSQLCPDLLYRILLLQPNQTHHPSKTVETDFRLPFGVRMLSVFLTEKEYEALLQSQRPKQKKSHCYALTPNLFNTPPDTQTDSDRKGLADSSSVSFHLTESSPDISAISDMDSDISSKHSLTSSHRRMGSEDRYTTEESVCEEEMEGNVKIIERTRESTNKSEKKTSQKEFSIENLTHLIKTISGHCLVDLENKDDVLNAQQTSGDHKLHSENVPIPEETDSTSDSNGLTESRTNSVTHTTNVCDGQHLNSETPDDKLATVTMETSTVISNADLEQTGNVLMNGETHRSANATTLKDGENCVDKDNKLEEKIHFLESSSSDKLVAMGTNAVEGPGTMLHEEGRIRVDNEDVMATASLQDVATGNQTGCDVNNDQTLPCVEDKPKSDSVDNNGQEAENFQNKENGMQEMRLYVQGHSKIILLLLMGKSVSQCEATIQVLWKSILPKLGELEIEIQQTLDKQPKKTGEAKYNFLVFDSDDRSLAGNQLEPVAATDHVLCQVAQLMHDEFNESETLSDMTVRNYSTVVCSRHTLSQETFYQPKGNIGPSQGAPSSQEQALLIESKAPDKLLMDSNIIVL
ncbi:BLOC-3 complex member HPS4-like [Glandiceps talaboti]